MGKKKERKKQDKEKKCKGKKVTFLECHLCPATVLPAPPSGPTGTSSNIPCFLWSETFSDAVSSAASPLWPLSAHKLSSLDLLHRPRLGWVLALPALFSSLVFCPGTGPFPYHLVRPRPAQLCIPGVWHGASEGWVVLTRSQ